MHLMVGLFLVTFALLLTLGSLYGFWMHVSEYADDFQHLRSGPGKSFPDGTYSGWSFAVFFASITVFFGTFGFTIARRFLGVAARERS